MSYIACHISYFILTWFVILVIIDYLVSHRINNDLIILIINSSVLKLMTHTIRGKWDKRND